jgi:hypothetical protein
MYSTGRRMLVPQSMHLCALSLYAYYFIVFFSRFMKSSCMPPGPQLIPPSTLSRCFISPFEKLNSLDRKGKLSVDKLEL